jgi:hypothetical protein
MGTYDQLMKFDQAKPVGSAKPEKSQAKVGVSPMVKEVPGRSKTRKEQTRRDTKPPRNHATTTPRYHDPIVEAIRAAVRVFGKEAATHRFTAQEKRAIRDIVYTYEGLGIRTNENEIARMGRFESRMPKTGNQPSLPSKALND